MLKRRIGREHFKIRTCVKVCSVFTKFVALTSLTVAICIILFCPSLKAVNFVHGYTQCHYKLNVS